jgi:hypothetical protein
VLRTVRTDRRATPSGRVFSERKAFIGDHS